MLSYLGPKFSELVGLTRSVVCGPRTLRATNVAAIRVLSYIAFLCRHLIEARIHEEHSTTKLTVRSQYAVHTAFNIGLFPLLFFFSGLYYTDVVSTTVVLGAYLNHLSRVGRDKSSFLSDILTMILGIAALFMRQTNVFWIVVYMGGLETVHAIKSLRVDRVDHPFFTTIFEQLKYYAWRHSRGDVHDPPLGMSWPTGRYSEPISRTRRLMQTQTLSLRPLASALRPSVTQ